MNVLKKDNNPVCISKRVGNRRYHIYIALDVYNELVKSNQLESFVASYFEKLV